MSSVNKPQRTLNYRDAGVDIAAGNALIERIKPAVRSTHTPQVLGDLGGFGGLFAMPAGYRAPVLVAGADGVGTKLLLAQRFAEHRTVGIDLVAMCVNDVIVQGATPLFFLDYYASSRLDPAVAADVIEGIATGCRQAGAALIGGETAEMPGMYRQDDYDLAGFCVGVAERDALITGQAVTAGDRIIGIASGSGAHSNGYSLIRRILETVPAPQDEVVENRALPDLLLEPTRIYVAPVLALIERVAVHALAHITGGGITENVPRVLPADHGARIEPARWTRPALFDWLQQRGGVADDDEMWRTFNCGIGMVAVVPAQDAATALEVLAEHGERACEIGEVVAQAGAPAVEFVR